MIIDYIKTGYLSTLVPKFLGVLQTFLYNSQRLQRILKQNAERRAEEWYKQNKGLDIAVTIVIAVGFILGLIVVVVAGIAGLLLALVVIIISAFSISSMFKG